jgi:hypothetical protein
MIRHIFFDKCNTIIENSEYNTGYNPVAEINAGNLNTRALFHFNLDEIQKYVNEGIINVNNLVHKIKMTNCGSINLPAINREVGTNCSTKKRAASIDVIAFKIPLKWDAGRGFDYEGDFVKESHRITSTDGCSWFQARNNLEWDEYGIYSDDTLYQAFIDKFENNKDTVIIGMQHFDDGTENFEIDVTEYVNNVLLGKEENNGIGLCFSPHHNITDDIFISFFTHHTNTCFLPYLEIINTEDIIDDRVNFFIGKTNKLYFFVSDNGKPINLDETPVCTIEDKVYEVKQNGVGVYYVEVYFDKSEIEPDTILVDTWSNLILNGEHLDNVEMEFLVQKIENKINLGKFKNKETNIYPQLSGIHTKEKIKIGDIREIEVDFIEEYSYGKKNTPTLAEYRIYIKEGDREIDIFPYQIIERYYDKNLFVINTNDLVPNTYHIDIKITQGRNIKIHNNILEFTIISNVTNYKK